MNHRIFIVEDDRVIAAAVKRHIESWGCEVRVVQDFRNVVKEFVAFDPHLVLMDIPCRSSTATTGAGRYATSPKCRSSSSPRPRTT